MLHISCVIVWSNAHINNLEKVPGHLNNWLSEREHCSIWIIFSLFLAWWDMLDTLTLPYIELFTGLHGNKPGKKKV